MGYIELQVTSNFSFLRGGSHPEELVEQAAELGFEAVAITDHNTMAGIVRAHAAAKLKKIRLIVGCRLNLIDGPSLLAYPVNKDAYARLCGLLSLGNLRTEKGKCDLYRADVFAHAEGMLFIVLPPNSLNERFELDPSFELNLIHYSKALGESLYLGTSRSYLGD
ncbi:MAG: PHP domain-containing protein, partial [Dyadobacter sp.]